MTLEKTLDLNQLDISVQNAINQIAAVSDGDVLAKSSGAIVGVPPAVGVTRLLTLYDNSSGNVSGGPGTFSFAAFTGSGLVIPSNGYYWVSAQMFYSDGGSSTGTIMEISITLNNGGGPVTYIIFLGDAGTSGTVETGFGELPINLTAGTYTYTITVSQLGVTTTGLVYRQASLPIWATITT